VNYVQDVLSGCKIVSSLIWTLKSKKPKKTLENLKTFSKKLGFFQPWIRLNSWNEASVWRGTEVDGACALLVDE